jgi:serine/threonine protein kinase
VHTQHPLIHPIKEVYYSANHEKLIIVQPYREDGSLKDLIYQVNIRRFREMREMHTN